MKIEIEIPEQIIIDTVISGCEGGIQYWAKLHNYNYKLVMKRTLKLTDHANDYERNPLDREILITDWQDGIRKMAEIAPRHFGNMIGNRGDATTGDVLIQCTLFGKIIYG